MPIVYYDGNCIYCYNYVIWLIQHELPRNYQFATLKGEVGQQFFKQHPEAANKNSVILQKGDRIYFESQAIIKLITALPNRTKLLGVGLWLVPKPVRNFGYRMFANNRNRMWKTTWHQPNDYEKSFFLDDNAKVKLID
ncbi:thiol-disulfide oxidoreductase DCC family protein [Staphylococcus aureus]|uniref:thiol-disulfide oxidoreductase DCC family protein n=1 Tax=Staphylococcus aureus TaxID=1280 RepID=UPI003EE3D634